ncbi:MAG: MFS transporter, partial [Pseudomonadota bacterium]
ADRTSVEDRAKGLAGFTAAFGIGTLLGPAFAGIAVAFGPLAPLYGVAALAACAFLAVFFFLPENNPPRERAPRPKMRMRDPRIFSFLIYGLAGGAVASVPVQMTGFYFIDILDLSGDEALARVSVALTASAMAALFAQLVLVGRFSMAPKQLMRFGPAALVIGHGLFAVGATFPVLVVGATFSGLGWGMVAPGFTAAASVSVSPHEQGATSGLSNAAGAAGFILAPPIGFGLYTIDPRAPFILTTLAAVALMLFAWRSRTIASLASKT